MVNVKATMTDIRVIIREFSCGTSLREMERKLKLSRTSLRNYRDRAEASGRSMVDLLALNDAELQAIMLKGDGHRGRDDIVNFLLVSSQMGHESIVMSSAIVLLKTSFMNPFLLAWYTIIVPCIFLHFL